MGQIFFILAKINKVGKVDELVSIFKNQIFNSLKLIFFHKTLKAVKYAMANKIILINTNTELFEVNIQKYQQIQHISL